MNALMALLMIVLSIIVIILGLKALTHPVLVLIISIIGIVVYGIIFYPAIAWIVVQVLLQTVGFMGILYWIHYKTSMYKLFHTHLSKGWTSEYLDTFTILFFVAAGNFAGCMLGIDCFKAVSDWVRTNSLFVHYMEVYVPELKELAYHTPVVLEPYYLHLTVGCAMVGLLLMAINMRRSKMNFSDLPICIINGITGAVFAYFFIFYLLALGLILIVGIILAVLTVIIIYTALAGMPSLSISSQSNNAMKNAKSFPEILKSVGLESKMIYLVSTDSAYLATYRNDKGEWINIHRIADSYICSDTHEEFYEV